MEEFHCEVLTPYRRFFAGQVESLSFVTHDGGIEILAGHESIVAPVRIGILRIRTEGADRFAAITEGFVRVKHGRADLFVDAAEWPEEIDRERAERALGRATQRLATETHDWLVASSKLASERAHNRLALARMDGRS